MRTALVYPNLEDGDQGVKAAPPARATATATKGCVDEGLLGLLLNLQRICSKFSLWLQFRAKIRPGAAPVPVPAIVSYAIFL